MTLKLNRLSTLSLLAAALALLALPGCKPSAPAGASTSTSTSAAAPQGDAELKALAFTHAEGKDAIDTTIRGLKARLELENNADAWAVLAQQWILKARHTQDPGYYLSADAAAQLALKADPGHALALGLRATVKMNQHRFAEARDMARAALRKDPESLTSLGALADALLELGEVDASANAVQQMVNLKPDLASYGRAAHLRWLHGDAETAKRFYRSAIDSGTNPRAPEPASWMVVQVALVFFNQGDLDGAEAGFQLALKRVPGYPPALVGLARVELARGLTAKAIPLLEQAWAKSQLVETGWLLGDARAASGDDKGARAAWDAAIALGERTDHLSLGNMLAAKSWRIPDALQRLEGELRERPNQAVRDAYSWALYRAGRFQEAKAQSDQVMSLGTPDPKYFFHAGAIRAAAGDPASGRALLERALKLNPAFDLEAARECKDLLAKLDAAAVGAVAGGR